MDVYAVGIILQKLVGNLTVSHELSEVMKRAVDDDEKVRATLQEIKSQVIRYQTRLITAIRGKKSDEALDIIQEGDIDFEIKDRENARTALHWALLKADVKVLTKLV